MPPSVTSLHYLLCAHAVIKFSPANPHKNPVLVEQRAQKWFCAWAPNGSSLQMYLCHRKLWGVGTFNRWPFSFFFQEVTGNLKKTTQITVPGDLHKARTSLIKQLPYYCQALTKSPSIQVNSACMLHCQGTQLQLSLKNIGLSTVLSSKNKHLKCWHFSALW